MTHSAPALYVEHQTANTAAFDGAQTSTHTKRFHPRGHITVSGVCVASQPFDPVAARFGVRLIDPTVDLPDGDLRSGLPPETAAEPDTEHLPGLWSWLAPQLQARGVTLVSIAERQIRRHRTWSARNSEALEQTVIRSELIVHAERDGTRGQVVRTNAPDESRPQRLAEEVALSCSLPSGGDISPGAIVTLTPSAAAAVINQCVAALLARPGDSTIERWPRHLTIIDNPATGSGLFDQAFDEEGTRSARGFIVDADGNLTLPSTVRRVPGTAAADFPRLLPGRARKLEWQAVPYGAPCNIEVCCANPDPGVHTEDGWVVTSATPLGHSHLRASDQVALRLTAQLMCGGTPSRAGDFELIGKPAEVVSRLVAGGPSLGYYGLGDQSIAGTFWLLES